MKGKCKMKTFLQHIRSALVFVGIFIPMTGKADVWALPENKTYYSENKEYKLIITPKIFPDKYNLWQYYTSAKHVKVKRFSRKKEKFMKSLTAQDTILIPCTAELYWTNDTSSILLWKKTLLNDICPVHAIIANDGSSIATFDNWYSSGYGVNVFVIYNEKGEAKRTYKLDEISPFPLNDYEMSISSLWWRKHVSFIDKKRIEIIFETSENVQIKRIYHTHEFRFEE